MSAHHTSPQVSPHPLSVSGVLAVHHQSASIRDGHLVDLTFEPLPRTQSVDVVALSDGVKKARAILSTAGCQVQLCADTYTYHLTQTNRNK